MDKADFLKFYRSKTKPLLTIHFYDDIFMADETIKVTLQTLTFKELRDFYVLRAVKNNFPDNRPVEERQNDSQIKLITLKEALENPEKWELDLKGRTIPPLEEIHPIPIATDLNSNQTLILDSNHLLANWPYREGAKVSLAHITGHNLERLVVDFVFLS